MRHRIAFGMVTITLLSAAFATALAQPPAGRDGPPPPGRGDGLRDALDTNGDHELDADEIKNASASLAKPVSTTALWDSIAAQSSRNSVFVTALRASSNIGPSVWASDFAASSPSVSRRSS